MKHQTQIGWHIAEQVSIQAQHQQTKDQEQALNEFLESNCDMFDYRDWQYYVDETGKTLEWLRANARYNDNSEEYGTLLNNALINGDDELIETFFL